MWLLFGFPFSFLLNPAPKHGLPTKKGSTTPHLGSVGSVGSDPTASAALRPKDAGESVPLGQVHLRFEGHRPRLRAPLAPRSEPARSARCGRSVWGRVDGGTRGGWVGVSRRCFFFLFWRRASALECSFQAPSDNWGVRVNVPLDDFDSDVCDVPLLRDSDDPIRQANSLVTKNIRKSRRLLRVCSH